ncbi:unnamed protein product [Candidula unifasciata]|uniref:Thioredoxin domain-containing protein n=1 Tax=Candidula unifasciata TaxID=100452 RepID=A0A8S3ZZF2_9EUPU|nr:unnamed protein product [Candidula unifasciata]
MSHFIIALSDCILATSHFILVTELENKEPLPDEYVKAEEVVGLQADNFLPFLKTKDVTLVMFYQPDCPACEFSRKHVKKASKVTIRNRHSYAAVNCEASPTICCSQKITSTPYFKMYSRGREIGFNDNPRMFTYKDMKHWVEQISVYNGMGKKM